MTWKDITSASNPTWRRWRRLAEFPREVRKQQTTLAEGIHLAQAALASEVTIAAAIVRAEPRDPAVGALVVNASERGAALYRLTATLFDAIAPVEHGVGLILELRLPTPAALRASTDDVVYLDGIQDPGNVGTMLRTAAAAGIRTVLTSVDTAAVWAPRTLRAGQGAHFKLSLHEATAPEALAQVIEGPWIGADAHRATPLWDMHFPPGPIGWIFGSEGRGLSEAARALCRDRVMIPLDPAAESLNVTAAAAVCLFERRRRRIAAGIASTV